LKLELPKIYPITDRDVSGLSHLEQVRRLADGGATMIQIREKTAPASEFYRDALEVVAFARERGLRIIINDRVDVAMAVGADGVHLGQHDLPPEEARRLLGNTAIVGFSTHSIEQASRAVAGPVDYIAIGPVFPTSTKAKPDPVVGLDGVRAVRSAIGDFPLVAIGGIDRETVNGVISAGADSVAIISDLLSDPDAIAARMGQFIQAEP
jgi:thiamine-phosphate pyrophosphorylase